MHYFFVHCSMSKFYHNNLRFAPPKLFVSPEQYDLIEAADLIAEVEHSLPYERHHELIQQQSTQYNSQREKQLREKLEAAGYTFEAGSSLFHFIKTRCRLEMDQHRKVTMYVDGKFFTTWWETFDVEMDTSNPMEIKATMIYGLPPENY